MNSSFNIEAVKNLNTLNLCKDFSSSLKVIIDPCFESIYHLYFSFPNIQRIVCYKFIVNGLSSKSNSKENTQSFSKSTVLRLYKTIYCPVSFFDLITSKNNVWIAAKEGFLSIRQFLGNKNSNKADEWMDISSENEEFSLCDLETIVSTNNFYKHNFGDKFFCLKCEFDSDCFLICYKNYEKSICCIVLAISHSTHFENDVEYIHILSFPCTDSSEYYCSLKEKTWETEVLFCNSNYPVWNNLFESKTLALSNYVCLLGQSNGNIAYTLCNWSDQRKEFKQLTTLQSLYRLEEPIICISMIEDIGKLMGSQFVTIIGGKGKLLLLTSEKITSTADSSQLVNGVWILCWQLPSFVQNAIVFKDCVIYHSFKGEVWAAKFCSTDSLDRDEKQCIQVISETTKFRNVSNLSLIDKLNGLFLMITNSGNTYLMQYTNIINSRNYDSLPIMMNEILEQSLLLKDLSILKHLQSKLFTALSTFASIKYKATEKFNLECKLTEVEGERKKLLLSINLGGLEQLNLDNEFWMISASLCSHFQSESAVITKSSPLGQTLRMEILESKFCPSYSSPFPLYLEVGLILRIPKTFKAADCFTDIVKKFPLYVKTNSTLLTELYLVKNKSKVLETSKFINVIENKNILQKISEKNIHNPLLRIINRILSSQIDTAKPIFTKYTLCFLESTAKEFLKSFKSESGLVQSIFHAIMEKSYAPSNSEGDSLICQDQCLSLSVLLQDKKVNVVINSESLLILGLKTAIAELLLCNQPKPTFEASNCVNIPATILKKCEEIAKELRSMYGQDVSANDFLGNIFKVYCKLRKEVTEKLPL